MSDAITLDLETLDMLEGVMGDDFQVLLSTFEEDSQQNLCHIREAIGLGDADALRRAAHSQKGSSGNLGAPRLSELCASLEAQAAAGDLSQARELEAQINSEMDKVREALQQR